jgi:hypothetical protein
LERGTPATDTVFEVLPSAFDRESLGVRAVSEKQL